MRAVAVGAVGAVVELWGCACARRGATMDSSSLLSPSASSSSSSSSSPARHDSQRHESRARASMRPAWPMAAGAREPDSLAAEASSRSRCKLVSVESTLWMLAASLCGGLDYFPGSSPWAWMPCFTVHSAQCTPAAKEMPSSLACLTSWAAHSWHRIASSRLSPASIYCVRV